MRKVILMLLLAVVGCKAGAEWVKLGASDNTTTYAAPSTIHKTGNKVEMMSVLDYATAQGSGPGKYMSIKFQNEYDCSEKKFRALASSWYSERMGEGKVVFTFSSSSQWNSVETGNINDAAWTIACGMK